MREAAVDDFEGDFLHAVLKNAMRVL